MPSRRVRIARARRAPLDRARAPSSASRASLARARTRDARARVCGGAFYPIERNPHRASRSRRPHTRARRSRPRSNAANASRAMLDARATATARAGAARSTPRSTRTANGRTRPARCPEGRDARRGARTIPRAGSTFGRIFRVTTFGESHGGGVGCVVDGVPPRLRTHARGAAVRARPATPGTEPNHDPAKRRGLVRDSERGRARRRHAGHARGGAGEE